MRVADILVVPSWYEPFGMVILEGMLHGLAIAAAAVGGPAEILEHERTGILFPPRDAKSLAEAVLRLAKDLQLRVRIALAGAEQLRRRWLWPALVKMMERLRRTRAKARIRSRPTSTCHQQQALVSPQAHCDAARPRIKLRTSMHLCADNPHVLIVFDMGARRTL